MSMYLTQSFPLKQQQDTELCFCCFCFSPHPTSEEAGGAQEVGRGHSRDSWPQLTQGIFHTIGCHAQHIKLGEEEGMGGCSEWWHLSSQVTITRNGALLSWRWLNTCLLMGSSEWSPYCVLLACTAFALHIKLSLSQPMRFHAFALLILSSILRGGSERAAVWGWAAYQG